MDVVDVGYDGLPSKTPHSLLSEIIYVNWTRCKMWVVQALTSFVMKLHSGQKYILIMSCHELWCIVFAYTGMTCCCGMC